MKDLIKVLGAKLWLVLSLFVSGVIVARIATPAEFGLYAAALSLILILDGVLGAPLDTSGVRFASLYADDASRVDRFLGALFRLKLLVAIAVGALLATSATVAGVPDWSWVLIAAVAFSTVCLMAARSVMNYLQVNLRFGTYSSLDLLLASLRLLFVCIAAYIGVMTAGPYVALYGLGALLIVLFGLFRFRQNYLLAPWPERDDGRAMLRHAGLVSLVIMLGTLTGRSDILILEARAGAESAGLYAAAFHMASVVTLLAGYISVVSQPRILAWVRDGRASGLVRLNMMLGIAASIVIVGVSYLLPQLVIWIFGDAYADARPLLNILLFGACLDLLIMPILLSFALQLLPRLALIAEAIIAAGFFAAVFAIDGLGPLTMAWIVTAVRGAKLLCYLGMFAFRQDAVQSSSSL